MATISDDGTSGTPESDQLVPPTGKNDSETLLEKGELLEQGEMIEQGDTKSTDEDEDEDEGASLTENESKRIREDQESASDVQLTESVYSIMYTARLASPAFVFAIIVFQFQMFIIGLILWDLFDHYNKGTNPFNVPPGVTPQVRVAQALALILAVATQGDVITAVVMLQRRYDERVLERCQYATRSKWFFSCICHLIAGGSFLIAIFTLVMQSSTVIAMMLNFAALSFVSEIDDVAFSLAKKGFLSEELEREAINVAELKVPTRQTSKTLRCVLFFAIYAGLMAGYGVIVHQQQSGAFLCQSLFLELGDGFAPEASSFSGFYDQTSELKDRRVTYIERRSKKSMLGYCDKENAWTFTTWLSENNTNDNPDDKEDPCRWEYKSEPSDSFDITTTSNSKWVINVGDSEAFELLQTFVLFCVDCGSYGTVCSGNGYCHKNECVCDQGWYGPRCEFSEPCPSLAVDARTSSFPVAFNEYTVFDQYDLLLNGEGNFVTVYEKPVYAFRHSSYWSLMMFLGRRWIATSTEIFDLLDNATITANATQAQLVGYLEDLHGYNSRIPVFFISEPMDIGTPSDGLTPVGLGWYRTKSNSREGILTRQVDTSQPLGTVMLCAVCDDLDNGCFFGNCTQGVCSCDKGYEGVLCELNANDTEARL